MTLIGFHGFAGVGKDEAAKVLIEEFSFTRLAFADPMREMLYALNPWVSVAGGILARVSSFVDEEGWDGAKRNYPEIRRLLQRLGTEGGRQILGENIWVDAAFRKVEFPNNYVFTDVRFPNEAARIRKEGGIVIRIERPGVTSVNSHVSDAGLPAEYVNCTIVNGGTIEDLRAKVRAVVLNPPTPATPNAPILK